MSAPKLVRIDLCNDHGMNFVLEDGRVCSFFDGNWSIYKSEEAHASVMDYSVAEFQESLVCSRVDVPKGTEVPYWVYDASLNNLEYANPFRGV